MKRCPGNLSAVWLSGLVAVALTLAGCETMRVGSDYDRHANFSSFRTFSIMQREHPDTGNPLVQQRTQDDIVRELTRKGYELTNGFGDVDFAVDFTIGFRERTDINTYPAPYGAAGWGAGPGWWGGPYWGTSVDVRQVREGTLSIDVFDGHTHRPVWHGWAKKDLSRQDIERSEEPIRAAVRAVLAEFPPSG